MPTSTWYCIPPPTYPPGGDIASPVFNPRGQFSVRNPHSTTIPSAGEAKFVIQTLSLPSTERNAPEGDRDIAIRKGTALGRRSDGHRWHTSPQIGNASTPPPCGAWPRTRGILGRKR